MFEGQIEAGQYASDRLWLEVRQLLRAQISLFLICWLAVIVPVVCDQHGMMSLLDLDSHTGHMYNPGQVLASMTNCELQHHHQSASAMTIELVTAVLPNVTLQPAAVQEKSLPLMDFLKPPQVVPQPLEQPPRFL